MQYERLSHVEHILKRPDSYVGSIPPEPATHWVREGLFFKISQLSTSPGLVKIFDEILVNAIDQYSMHPKKVTEIKIGVSGSGSILIQN